MNVNLNAATRKVVAIVVIAGWAALAGAADGGDSFTRMKALAAKLRRVQTGTSSVAPLVSSGGFAKTYGGTKSDDGFFNKQIGSNFLLTGTTDSFGPVSAGGFLPWILEIDGSGNPVLQQVWGTSQTELGEVGFTPDGGYFVSLLDSTTPGQTFLQLIRLNSSFGSVWQKQYGVGGEGLESAVVLADNSFLLEGSTVLFSTSGIHADTPSITFAIVLVKTDSSGNIVWQKVLTSPVAITLAFQQQADGSFTGIGTIAVGPNDIDILIVKLDSSGNIVWQKRYGGSLADEAFQVLPISGGYLVPGLTTSFGAGKSDMWLLKLDGSGNILKQETIGGIGDEFGLVQAISGGYVMSGSTESSGAGGRDGWLAFLDSNLNLTSSKTLGGAGDESLVAFADSAGGYLLFGDTNSFGGGGEDGWVIKTDNAGVPIWQNAYGGSADESAGVFRISGGGLLLSGSTSSWGAGEDDAFAALLDANGNLAGGLGTSIGTLDMVEPNTTGCGLVHPTTVAPANFPATVSATSVTPVTTTLTEANDTITTSAIALSPINTTATVADICGAPSHVGAVANADSTSGTAPFTVHFTGSGTGGTPPYTYDWDFGDTTADSSQQNPTHVYTGPGYFNVTLTVTDSKSTTATDSHIYINATFGQCTVGCSATVPTTGTVGVAVAFTSTATPSGCVGSTTFLWNFGDGTTSTEQNPTHPYSQAKTYNWTFAVTSGSSTCNKSGSITISSAAQQEDVFVVVGSNASGINQSLYNSDLGLLNTGTGTAHVHIKGYIGGSIYTKDVTVGPGAQLILTNIVQQLGATGSGALEITVPLPETASLAGLPVKVTARTYNLVSGGAACYPNGTQGQDYIAATTGDGLSAGQSAWLGQLTENASYRTNIGVTNTGSTNMTGTVFMYDAAGHSLGSYGVSLTPGQWQQVTQPFKNNATPKQSSMAAGYAKLAVTAGSGVLSYASVLNNITNDPTTINPLVADSGTDVWIAVGSHANGLLNSQYRSDLGLLNTGAASANVQVKGYIGGSTYTKSLAVAAGAQVILTDVVGQLNASGSGAIEIVSNHPLKVTARTYNQVAANATCYASGTQGQDYLSATASQGFSAGQSAWLGGLTENASYRTNIGVTNTGNTNMTATVYMYDAAGHSLGSYGVSLAPGQWQQVTQPFKNNATPKQTSMAAGYAKVTINSGSGAQIYASVLNNITNDPTTINPLL